MRSEWVSPRAAIPSSAVMPTPVGLDPRDWNFVDAAYKVARRSSIEQSRIGADQVGERERS